MIGKKIFFSFGQNFKTVKSSVHLGCRFKSASALEQKNKKATAILDGLTVDIYLVT